MVEGSGTTVLLVTRDVDEALLPAERVALDRPRRRTTLAEQPGHAALRHHLPDFLHAPRSAVA